MNRLLSVLIFLFFISAALPQSDSIKSYMLNPDGEVLSFNVTPYMTTGKILNNELTPTLCMKLEFVAPLANVFTLKIFYDYMNTTYDTRLNSIFNGDVPIQLNKFGATLSFYFE